MSRPTEEIEWAEGASAQVDEPDALRPSGFPFGFVPAAQQINWMWRTVGRWVKWLKSGGGFPSISELINELEVGEAAPLLASSDFGAKGDVSALFVAGFDSSLTVRDMCADGRQCWVLIGPPDSGTSNQSVVETYSLVRFYFEPGTGWEAETIRTYEFVRDYFVRCVCHGDRLVIYGRLNFTGIGTDDTLIECLDTTNPTAPTEIFSREEYLGPFDDLVGLCVDRRNTYETYFDSGLGDRITRSRRINTVNSGTGIQAWLNTYNGEFRCSDGRRLVAVNAAHTEVEIFDLDIPSSETGATTGSLARTIPYSAAGAAFAAIHPNWIVISLPNDDFLITQNASSVLAKVTTKSGFLPYNRLEQPVDDRLFVLNAGGYVIDIDPNTDVALGRWWVDAIEAQGSIAQYLAFAHDTQFLYVAAELTTGETYVYALHRAPDARILRRVDPRDAGTWTRVPAIP